MSEPHKIIRITGTRTVLQGAGLANKQIAIETDHNETHVWKDDDGTYHIGAEVQEDLTSGSVLFATSSGKIYQDNSNFSWDNSNKILSITGTHADGQQHWYYDATHRFRVDVQSDGTVRLIAEVDSEGWAEANVAIGDIAPSHKLDVNGNIRSGDIIYTRYVQARSTDGLILREAGSVAGLTIANSTGYVVVNTQLGAALHCGDQNLTNVGNVTLGAAKILNINIIKGIDASGVLIKDSADASVFQVTGGVVKVNEIRPMSGNALTFHQSGAIVITKTSATIVDVYQDSGSATDSAVMRFNNFGNAGGQAFFRDIGFMDGKGVQLLFIDGSVRKIETQNGTKLGIGKVPSVDLDVAGAIAATGPVQSAAFKAGGAEDLLVYTYTRTIDATDISNQYYDFTITAINPITKVRSLSACGFDNSGGLVYSTTDAAHSKMTRAELTGTTTCRVWFVGAGGYDQTSDQIKLTIVTS